MFNLTINHSSQLCPRCAYAERFCNVSIQIQRFQKATPYSSKPYLDKSKADNSESYTYIIPDLCYGS